MVQIINPLWIYFTLKCSFLNQLRVRGKFIKCPLILIKQITDPWNSILQFFASPCLKIINNSLYLGRYMTGGFAIFLSKWGVHDGTYKYFFVQTGPLSNINKN